MLSAQLKQLMDNHKIKLLNLKPPLKYTFSSGKEDPWLPEQFFNELKEDTILSKLSFSRTRLETTQENIGKLLNKTMFLIFVPLYLDDVQLGEKIFQPKTIKTRSVRASS